MIAKIHTKIPKFDPLLQHGQQEIFVWATAREVEGFTCGGRLKQAGYRNQFNRRPPFIEVVLEIMKGCQRGKIRVPDSDGRPMFQGISL